MNSTPQASVARSAAAVTRARAQFAALQHHLACTGVHVDLRDAAAALAQAAIILDQLAAQEQGPEQHQGAH